jgi:hypothetical protein
MQIVTRCLAAALICGLLLTGITCEQGLEQIEGIQGTVYFPYDSTANVPLWPDTLNGAFVVIAEYQSIVYQSIDSVFTHIIAYSDPLEISEQESGYSIQLKPGYYIGGVVGIKGITLAEIAFMPLDSLVTHLEYFKIIGVYESASSSLGVGKIKVLEDQVTDVIDIHVNYDYQLPF